MGRNRIFDGLSADQRFMLRHPEKRLSKNEAKRQWDATHIPERKAYRKIYREQNREHIALKRHESKLKQYGISIQEYDRMFREQHGVCAICRRPETAQTHPGQTTRLAVDHNHMTKRVRGLLCSRCNPAVGFLKDNPLLARALADYIERTSAEDGEVTDEFLPEGQ